MTPINDLRLRDYATLLELPTDRPRPAQQVLAGAVVAVELDAQLTRELKALGQRRGMTLFMTILAGWAAVLSRLAGQEDVVIGTPVANRTRTESEGLIGLFVNTQAIRVSVSGSVGEVLERVKARTLEAQENQDLPFEQVVELAGAPRIVSHTPVFQVMFSWQNAAPGDFNVSGLQVSELRIPEQTLKFDLDLDLSEVGDRVVGRLRYATALFDRGTIERQVGYLYRMLGALVCGDGRQPVDEVDILSEAERHQLLVGWNDTRVPYPEDRCVHELFEDQAVKTPHAVALAYEGHTLTYEELNRRANQLARHLRGLGVRPDDRVAICVERSLAMMVGMLGILKAGGAYVPLDPSYPAERLAYMLEDSAPVALLIHQETQDVLRVDLPVVALDLEEDMSVIGRQPGHDLDPKESGLTSRHLAYVIYTSGSTGRPKGAMNEHHALVNRLTWGQRLFPLDGTDRVLQKTPIGFDVSVWEMLHPLVTGATLVIARPQGHRDPAYLADIIEQAGITTLHFVPSMLQLFLEQLDEQNFSTHRFAGLRRMHCSGEALGRALQRRMQERFPGVELHNLYGPTETAIEVTWYSCDPLAARTAVPIGRPIDNTQIYVLDQHLSPTPIGVAGEIYIAGTPVGRGYLNRPELTAERFLADPFREAPARMYRTGDLGRRLPDGNVEYAGRNDFQVKIRGMRVELGEIETALVGHPGVTDARVLLRDFGPDDQRLIAYVIPSSRQARDARLRTSLQEHLRTRLPEHMVPAYVVCMSEFPLNANGKLDRNALPDPDADAADRPFEPPVGEMEIALAGIWTALLKCVRVGRQDDFFELGGHSLLAVMLRSRLRQALKLDIALRDIFSHSDLQGMAHLLQGRVPVDAAPPVRLSREQPLPLSFAQQRLWFLAQLPGVSETYQIPIGLRVAGDLDIGALKRALDRIVWRHEALRTSFRRIDDRVLQHIEAPDRGFPLVEEDLRERSTTPGEVERRLLEELRRPFDLTRGPLIRGRLMRLADREHALLITVHHIVFDGWSLGLFREELGALYQEYRAGRLDERPVLAIQYADYATWQREQLTGELLRRQCEYWRDALSGAATLLELPTDRPRPAQQVLAGAVVAVELDAQLTRELKALGQRRGMTLFMTILAGWAAVLSRLAGQEDVVIGTPVANRTRTESEGLIGLFVNTQAIRVSVSGSVGEVLERVKARTLEAQENQDLPFEQVVELAGAPRIVSHTPVFQVMFSWQNAAPGDFNVSGLQVSELRIPEQTLKFDLDLDLSEVGDRVVGRLRYATALFDRGTIERQVGYLYRMLGALVCGDGRQPVDEVDILSEAERHQLLVGWNDTRVPYPEDRCVHELFEDQAVKTPHAVALAYEGHTLTYEELNRRANQLARHLRGLGVRPDDRVAICVERSLAMMVGMLGILKAGGAYVPLDPSYPAERLAYMLEDSAPVALLIHQETQDVLRVDLPVVALDLEEDMSVIGRQPGHDLDPKESGLTSRHLAYVIYTSGSTGRPKGAMNEHHALVNRLTWGQRLFPLDGTDRVLQKTPIGFDVSVWEMLHPLVTGATLVIARPQGHRDPAYLADIIEQAGITTLHFVPSMLQLFLEQLDEQNFSTHRFAALKHVLSGGEVLRPALRMAIHAALPNAKLFNLYGPSEAAIDVTSYACVQPLTRSAVPIGGAVDNTQIYVLDRHLRPVPTGVTGEICVGGVAVGRGYLNRPELTAERFLADPFREAPARLYRTGDLGRRLPDGNVEYAGRNDFQVKIRGFRIELGEIERVLLGFPDIKETVVIADTEFPGREKLIGYVVTTKAGPISSAVLRTRLKRHLPDYMLPTSWVFMGRLPLNDNGKVDRGALPKPDSDRLDLGVEFVSPQNEIETTLAQVWAQVLNVSRIGIHDDFFALGGHSISATQLIWQLNDRGMGVSVSALFQNPTVHSLARCIDIDVMTI